MSDHYIIRCEDCGTIIQQCRCPSPDKKETAKGTCEKCMTETDKKGGDIIEFGEAEIIRRMDAMESRGRARALYFMDIKEIITDLLTKQNEATEKRVRAELKDVIEKAWKYDQLCK